MTDDIRSVGFRNGTIFVLNENGRPAASGTTAYEGIDFAGPKAYTLSVPEPRRIAHVGRDQVEVIDQLPSLEPISGEIRVSGLSLDMDAALTDVTKRTVGVAQGLARATNKQGSELQIGILAYQQSLDKETGLRRWHFHIIPSTRAIPITASFGENPEDHRYAIAPTPSGVHLWGEALSETYDGALTMGFWDGYMPYKPCIVAFLGDGTTTDFDFPAAKHVAAADVTFASVKVFKNGVEVTSGITKSASNIQFTVAPADGSDIVVFYGID